MLETVGVLTTRGTRKFGGITKLLYLLIAVAVT